jgi:uncharacterized protein YciI
MRLIILLIAVMFFACKQKESKTETQEQEMENTNAKTVFDSIKAAEYGADDYGMKSYVMAFLKKGPNRDLDSAEADKLQRAHLDNIGKMAEAGKLVLAGPFFDDGDLRGIYIFDVETIEEAQQHTESDPAIQAGSLVMELKQWYGSAALLEVGKTHATIAKKEI